MTWTKEEKEFVDAVGSLVRTSHLDEWIKDVTESYHYQLSNLQVLRLWGNGEIYLDNVYMATAAAPITLLLSRKESERQKTIAEAAELVKKELTWA